MPKGYNFAYGFEAYTLNPPRYLAHLSSKLSRAGVPILRRRVSSLDEAYEVDVGGGRKWSTELVINATGLGSRTLIGVEDPLVHPARGQTVTVYAPNVRTCYSTKDKKRLQGSGVQTYIIPRPGPEGHVTLGGTYEKGNWSTLPDPGVAERILKECYALCPALGVEGEGWESVQVVSHNVGLRPAREGGMRLELEKRVVGRGGGLIPLSARKAEKGPREVAVVHAYGIGPAG